MSLTDEDKAWIVSAIRTTIKEETRELTSTLTAAVVQLESRIEGIETALLAESHKWPVPAEQRLRWHREALRALDLQIETIGGRVAKLEAAQGWPLLP
ncbi:MAG: hypothetical protein M3N54_02720 [Acidobacteriota bacterium]|nr:hypothetical protein [Acidobacteriota bacterium]